MIPLVTTAVSALPGKLEMIAARVSVLSDGMILNRQDVEYPMLYNNFIKIMVHFNETTKKSKLPNEFSVNNCRSRNQNEHI